MPVVLRPPLAPNVTPATAAKERRTLRELASEYWADRPMELAAALSYYTLLSLAPLVLVTVALAGLVVDRTAVEDKIVAEMHALVGAAGAEVAQTVLRSAADPRTGRRSVLIGLGVLLVGATTVFVQLQSALNRIWHVEANPRTGALWSFVRERLVSFAMVLGVGFLLLVSLLVSAALAFLAETTAAMPVGEWAAVLRAVHAAGSLLVVALLFAMIFKVLPDAPMAWRDVWLGAATTSVLFALGKYVIGLYLGRAGVGSAYGAAGSVVVFTVWVYYASLILLLGAKLTYFWSRRPHAARR